MRFLYHCLKLLFVLLINYNEVVSLAILFGELPSGTIIASFLDKSK